MRRTILIVEPDPRELARLRQALAPTGHRLIAASRSEDAIAHLPAAALDLALLDAAATSPEGARAIRARGRPAFVLLRRAGESGIEPEATDVVLERPASPEALLGTIESLLAAREALPSEPGPFAELLREVTDQRPSLAAPTPTTPLDARLAARMSRALVTEGLRLGPRHVAACFRACLAVVGEELARRSPDAAAASGDLERVPVEEVLRLAAALEPCASCRFERGPGWVELWLHGETVVAMTTEGLEPAPRSLPGVVSELLGWRGGRFTASALRELPPEVAGRSEALPLPALLLEAARRRDEARRRAEPV